MTTRTRRLLAVATAVAVVGTVGSLWFSLGLGLVPCELCWYQRILLYPLTVVLGVATMEDRPAVVRTVLPLSAVGVVVAAYHVLLQLRPTVGATCSVDGGCSSVLYPMLGGLLTIPRLSLLAFLLVTGLSVAVWLHRDGGQDQSSRSR
ncbi:disulfide bond formation protein B [Halobellus rufus]|uniref:disulfide bond formation protein B n=1 Tax=Halobellus rufus TaxID=1448860 RepID=UPI0006797F3E|nr:disulfide bond formation protein B [Halobellus rufus]